LEHLVSITMFYCGPVICRDVSIKANCYICEYVDALRMVCAHDGHFLHPVLLYFEVIIENMLSCLQNSVLF
jgi:hypothetical protein